ncbi:MAG: lysophospholipid acyltransferase family protein [Candidatus Cryptobacteroides sp.]
MIDPSRQAVIDNIKAKVAAGRFNEKVELGDPVLSQEQMRLELEKIVAERSRFSYKLKNFISRRAVDLLALKFNRETRFVGEEKLKKVKGSAIVTSNHFAPFENTIIRRMAARAGRGPLRVVSQDTNFFMDGWKGFFLRYTDLIPVSRDRVFMSRHFEPLLRQALKGNHFVLIYPEQEMWFNYRKPRPLKRGAYHYAAKMGLPVIPCFVQMDPAPGKGPDGIGNIRCTLHIMDPIFPDPAKSLKENSIEMMKKDYELKKEAYEKAYGKALDYTFEDWDIAGFND